jgi:hypothetical protein
MPATLDHPIVVEPSITTCLTGSPRLWARPVALA